MGVDKLCNSAMPVPEPSGLESLHDEVGTSPGRFDLPGDATADRSETVSKGNEMKKCLLVIGLVLFIGGGIYGWWWIQPMRQMSTLSQAAGPGPAIGSEEFSQEYPQLASVFEWFGESWFEEPMIQRGGAVDGGEVINRVYQVSSSRVFYGAYMMFAGLLIVCIPLLFKVFNLLLGRFVVRPVKGAEKFAPNHPSNVQQG